MQGVTLDTIGGGALSELFGAELARILANIADPNTDATTKRAISITVSFKPKADREIADVELKCGSKLAGIMTVSTRLFMGRHQGKLIAPFEKRMGPLCRHGHILDGVRSRDGGGRYCRTCVRNNKRRQRAVKPS